MRIDSPSQLLALKTRPTSLIPQSPCLSLSVQQQPMATELALNAKEAFVDDDFQLAVALYSQAIELEPNNADLYADRSQANIKLNNFTEAVDDANKAIGLNPMLAKAYLRKGTACIKLEEYATAMAALEKGASIAPVDSRFKNLINQCQLHLPEAEVGVTTSTQIKPAAPINPKYRHTFYQKPEEVVVTIFAKGIPAENVKVDFGEQILSVTISVHDEEPYHFQPRLFGKIMPEKCTYVVLSTKVEIHLAKADQINWATLESSVTKVVVPQKVNTSMSVASSRPTYPSSKPKGTDWDQLVAQVKKEEKDEKLDGDAALNKFFREIYGDADDDMRRAMVKSFVESNGTVLSTDWKDVGSKYVAGSAPDGMEMKKW